MPTLDEWVREQDGPQHDCTICGGAIELGAGQFDHTDRNICLKRIIAKLEKEGASCARLTAALEEAQGAADAGNELVGELVSAQQMWARRFALAVGLPQDTEDRTILAEVVTMRERGEEDYAAWEAERARAFAAEAEVARLREALRLAKRCLDVVGCDPALRGQPCHHEDCSRMRIAWPVVCAALDPEPRA